MPQMPMRIRRMNISACHQMMLDRNSMLKNFYLGHFHIQQCTCPKLARDVDNIMSVRESIEICGRTFRICCEPLSKM
jgi:hypothetical protein